jgi:hypothetical protein
MTDFLDASIVAGLKKAILDALVARSESFARVNLTTRPELAQLLAPASFRLRAVDFTDLARARAYFIHLADDAPRVQYDQARIVADGFMFKGCRLVVYGG